MNDVHFLQEVAPAASCGPLIRSFDCVSLSRVTCSLILTFLASATNWNQDEKLFLSLWHTFSLSPSFPAPTTPLLFFFSLVRGRALCHDARALACKQMSLYRSQPWQIINRQQRRLFCDEQRPRVRRHAAPPVPGINRLVDTQADTTNLGLTNAVGSGQHFLSISLSPPSFLGYEPCCPILLPRFCCPCCPDSAIVKPLTRVQSSSENFFSMEIRTCQLFFPLKLWKFFIMYIVLCYKWTIRTIKGENRKRKINVDKNEK